LRKVGDADRELDQMQCHATRLRPGAWKLKHGYPQRCAPDTGCRDSPNSIGRSTV
jgi:hypothetical protein